MSELNDIPVKVGEQHELECVSIGAKGDGIFKFEGMVIIVPNTEVGNIYKVNITVVTKTVAFGEIDGDNY